MSFSRRAFRRLLGTRLPTTEGVMTVAGLDGHVAIGRDRYSIPHITANTAHDAWFALGSSKLGDVEKQGKALGSTR